MTTYRISIATILLFVGSVASAGPKTYVGAKVDAGQRVSINNINHADWDQLLRKYVDTRGGVDYAGWQASAADLQLLDRYLAHLSSASLAAPSARGAQLAYFINAYNAVTVRGILQKFPTSSIRNHTAKLVGYNIWHDLLLQVDDRELSLDSIEHKMLRKMSEPRMHFAIVCASISCPRLLNEAYVADRLEAQLSANTKDFFANPRNFRFDPNRGQFQLSSILNWFGEDFGSDKAAQLAAIAPYLPDATSAQAAASGSVKVGYLDYNWGLNDQQSMAAERELTLRRWVYSGIGAQVFVNIWVLPTLPYTSMMNDPQRMLDPAAWLDNYGDYLFRYAVSRLRNPEAAEEVVQETLVSGFQAAKQYAGTGDERAWLMGILKRKIIDYARKRQRELTSRDPDSGPDITDRLFDDRGKWRDDPRIFGRSPDASMQSEEFWEMLRGCLDDLPEKQRNVFALREIDGVSSDEIRRELSITSSNFWVLLHRARLRLSDCVKTKWHMPGGAA